MKEFLPKGALELVRKYDQTLPKANMFRDIRICIAGTQHALPVGRKSAGLELDLSASLPAILRAAMMQLRKDMTFSTGESISKADQRLLLLADPLFSEDWYAEHYKEVALTKLQPVDHFLSFSKTFERPASLWFDTESYLKAAPSAKESDLVPLVHYKLHGHEVWWPGQDRFRPTRPSLHTDQKEYALLIHICNIDAIPDLQRLVSNFPGNTDVFITIPDDSPDHHYGEIAALFPEALEISVVPDRGCDVRAFLDVVRRIKKRGYRFFCKAHSKKGNSYPDVRRRIMFDGLAATPERVTEVVDLFSASPRVLMAGPAQFWFHGADFQGDIGPLLDEAMVRMGFGSGAVAGDWAFFSGACFWIDAELAATVADAFGDDVIDDIDSTSGGKAAQVFECLFSLVAATVGGRFALVDACDWTAPLVTLTCPDEGSVSMDVKGDGEAFIARHLQELIAPQAVNGGAVQSTAGDPNDVFGEVDVALHGSIDVLISCWTGKAEVLHGALARLGKALEVQGLTWAGLVRTSVVKNVFLEQSCHNIFIDSLYFEFPKGFDDAEVSLDAPLVDHEVALSWLKSQCIFRNTSLPMGAELGEAIDGVQRLYAYWRKILLRHKVKVFLIWGETAPKSRMFLQLCRELQIEYKLIERGHFPGTISIDPLGQFGTGVRPRLIEHGQNVTNASEINEKFVAIRDWYETQKENSSYYDFQQRETRDVRIMERSRRHGRPVILVIGGNDPGSGTVTPDPAPHRLNWFGNSDNAFTIIRQMVASKFPEALLVLRPHPSQAALEEGEFFLVARKASLDELIDNADLCITISTTVSAVCLLKEKPLLTLGLSEITGQNVGESITDESHLLAALRKHVWTDFANPYPEGENRSFIVDLFDRQIVGIDRSVPTRYDITDLARFQARRIQRMKTGFLHEYAGHENQISQAMFEDVRDRGRAIFRVDGRAFSGGERPRISIVLPIYGDYEGTRLCFEQLTRYQAQNGYRVITVWDRGPDLRLRDLCHEYAEKGGFICLENRENVGFSGTVNAGILYAGTDDVILLNSDTLHCDDWALRLQDAAYAHSKIAAVVPMTNNATVFSVPFPNGTELPVEPVEWVRQMDGIAKRTNSRVVEMPVAHGFCTYVRRTAFDRIGLYDEMGFSIGQGEDNDFSMRIRMCGHFVGAATGVFVGHAGSTSFGDEVMSWKQAGRSVMNQRYPAYMDEIRLFAKNDPLSRHREVFSILSAKGDLS